MEQGPMRVVASSSISVYIECLCTMETCVLPLGTPGGGGYTRNPLSYWFLHNMGHIRITA